jgi:hypothetical protein
VLTDSEIQLLYNENGWNNPFVTLSSPVGGETWYAGTTQNITWTSKSITKIKLEYSTDSGTNWQLITDTTSAAIGTYTWKIPTAPSTTCKVKISDASDATINSISTTVFTIKTLALSDGLVAYYPFNSNANDESGNGNNGTVNGATLTVDRFGNANNAYSFNGSNNYIDCGKKSILDLTGSMTICSWIKFPELPTSTSDYGIFMKAEGGSYGLEITNGKLQCDFYINGSYRSPGTSINNIQLGKWYFVLAKYDGSKIDFYLNGIKKDSLNISGNITITNVPLCIGADPTAASPYYDMPFKGMVDDSRLYNRALTASEIQTLYKENDWDIPFVKLTSPIGGENFAVGQTFNITWASNNVTNVKLEYSTDSGTNWLTIIESTLASARTYAWTIPNTASTNCKVRISDASNATVNNVSNKVFTIFQAVVTKEWDMSKEYSGDNNPNGVWSYGRKWSATDTDFTLLTVKWGSNGWYLSGSNGHPSIQGGPNLWAGDNGLGFPVVRWTCPSTGNFNVNGFFIGADSRGVDVTVYVTLNNATIFTGTVQAYDAKAPFLFNKLSIQKDDKLDFMIKSNSGGSYDWTVVNGTIQQLGENGNSIVLTKPNGGEYWTVGSTQNITWTSTGVDNVKIEYTASNGMSWATIITSLPAVAGTYSWIVPNTASENCKVRISDASDATVNSVSANVFTISSTTLTDGLVAYYPFNGNANDESGNGNNGTVNGATLTTDRFGVTDKAYSFNGSNNYIDCGKKSILDITGAMTISSWIKLQELPTSTSNYGIFMKNENGSYGLEIYNGKIESALYINGSYQNQGTSISNLQVGKWHFVLAKYDGNSIVFYLDAIKKDTVNISGNIAVTDLALLIGANPTPASPYYANCFKGFIDDSRIYNRALTDSEILQLYSENGWPLTSSVTLTSPNGGENWVIGSTHNITWKSNNVTNVKLEYTTNNGTNWSTVIASTAASAGTYIWTVPNTASTNCKVRISDVNDAIVNSVSANVFTISQAAVKTLSITKPVGGENWSVGSAQSITWGSANITSVKIEYTTNNGTNWSTVIANTPANTGSYTWSVPSTPSANCKVRISDASDATLNSISGSVFTIFSYPSSLALNTTISFSGIDNQNYYKIVGLPGQTSFGISTILASNGTQKTDWNVYYDNGASTNYYQEYDGTSTFNFTPGNAFWVISKNPVTVSKTVSTVTLSSDQSYSIALRSGWNLISNPFGISISWSDVKTKNNITQPIWSFVNSYTQSSTFDPYVGYYYYNSTSLSSLKIPYKTSLGKISAEKLEGLKLSLKADNKEVDAVEIRYDERSNTGLDNYDIYSPGDLFVNASMSIVHSEGRERENILKEDIRPALGEGQEYTLQVKNAKQQKLNLRVTDNTISEPVYLIDDELKNVVEINGDVKLQSTSKNKTYRLIVGKTEYISQLKKEYLPTEFQLYQNYPNPFNPSTVIRYSIPAVETLHATSQKATSQYISLKIFDVLGREISTLVNESKTAGTYEVEFNASNIPSGVYLYRLQSGENYITKKLMLLK